MIKSSPRTKFSPNKRQKNILPTQLLGFTRLFGRQEYTGKVLDYQIEVEIRSRFDWNKICWISLCIVNEMKRGKLIIRYILTYDNKYIRTYQRLRSSG